MNTITFSVSVPVLSVNSRLIWPIGDGHSGHVTRNKPMTAHLAQLLVEVGAVDHGGSAVRAAEVLVPDDEHGVDDPLDLERDVEAGGDDVAEEDEVGHSVAQNTLHALRSRRQVPVLRSRRVASTITASVGLQAEPGLEREAKNNLYQQKTQVGHEAKVERPLHRREFVSVYFGILRHLGVLARVGRHAEDVVRVAQLCASHCLQQKYFSKNTNRTNVYPNFPVRLDSSQHRNL